MNACGISPQQNCLTAASNVQKKRIFDELKLNVTYKRGFRKRVQNLPVKQTLSKKYGQIILRFNFYELY
jgi:hypothetical protein